MASPESMPQEQSWEMVKAEQEKIAQEFGPKREGGLPFKEYAKSVIDGSMNLEQLYDNMNNIQRNVKDFIETAGVPFSAQEIIDIVKNIDQKIKNGEKFDEAAINQELQRIPRDLGLQQRITDLLKIEQIKQLLH